jgi:hypothetical protein
MVNPPLTDKLLEAFHRLMTGVAASCEHTEAPSVPEDCHQPHKINPGHSRISHRTFGIYTTFAVTQEGFRIETEERYL